MSQTCLLITLIKCLKGHKSLGSLCSVVKGLIVSWVQPRYGPTKGQGHLLSCSGQLKKMILPSKSRFEDTKENCCIFSTSLFNKSGKVFFAVEFARPGKEQFRYKQKSPKTTKLIVPTWKKNSLVKNKNVNPTTDWNCFDLKKQAALVREVLHQEHIRHSGCRKTELEIQVWKKHRKFIFSITRRSRRDFCHL